LRTHPGELLRTKVLTDTREFCSLEEEWEELYQDSPRATPFQSWAWLYSWWEFYGVAYELRLITVRNGEGVLVGGAPLMLDRRLGFSRLLFVGTGLTDVLDVLIKEGWEDQVSEVLAGTLGQIDSWQVADFQHLRPEAIAWGVIAGWTGPRVRVWQDGCLVIDAKPWDQVLSALSKNHRKTVRRTLRQAEADGIRCELASAADIENAARRLVALHRELWQGRDIGPEHLSDRFESHIVAAARRMTARAFGGISEFWREERVIISDFVVFGGDFLGTYMVGASQEALRRYQWSSLYIWDALNIARSKDVSQLDLLRGEDPYKLRWDHTVVPLHRMILGRHLTTWMPYAGYHVLRSKARQHANSANAPEWAKKVAETYRTLRRRVIRHPGRNKQT
jgi:CelD/BcsL family acetyltransferase involved in cellulose biosynthesis